MLLIFSNTKKASSSGGADQGKAAVYLNTAFYRKTVKVWNGTSWITGKVRAWDGTSWKYTYVGGTVLWNEYEDSTDSGTYLGNVLTAAPNQDPVLPSGMAAWYRADSLSGLADGAKVASWPDLSGNGYTATQGTVGVQPIYKASVINGKPVVRFPDSTYAALSSSLSRTQAETIVVVMQIPRTNQVGSMVGSTASGLQFRINAAKINVLKQGTADLGSGATALEINTPYTVSAAVDAVSSPNIVKLYRNGVLDGSFTDARNYDVAGTVIGSNVASAVNGAENFIGDIAEIFIYNRILTDSERGAINSYAQNRYGIATSDYVAGNPDPGMFISQDSATVSENANDPGTYLILT